MSVNNANGTNGATSSSTKINRKRTFAQVDQIITFSRDFRPTKRRICGNGEGSDDDAVEDVVDYVSLSRNLYRT